MSRSQKRGLADFGTGSRIYAIAANMLEGVDGTSWRAQGLTEGDVMFAGAVGVVFLRINSIELGLKHILDVEMGKEVPRKHDLVVLWDRLDDVWRKKVAKASGVSTADIRETLGHYRDAAVNLRYGGALGAVGNRGPKADIMQKHATVLQKLANALAGRSCGPIMVEEVKPQEIEG